MSFGENLKRLRRDKGYTQKELANDAGMKIGHISTLENDDGDPKLSTIYKLMESLGCSADALLFDVEKTGISGALKAQFDRANQLDETSKFTLVDLIDHYCIAEGFQKLMEPKKWIGGFRYLDPDTKNMRHELDKVKNKD